jgi:hypothetical protein
MALKSIYGMMFGVRLKLSRHFPDLFSIARFKDSVVADNLMLSSASHK